MFEDEKSEKTEPVAAIKKGASANDLVSWLEVSTKEIVIGEVASTKGAVVSEDDALLKM